MVSMYNPVILQSPHLSTATEIFLEKTYKIKQSYGEAAKKYMDSETQLLDFKKAPSEAEKSINSWVDKQTKGLIRDLIPPGK